MISEFTGPYHFLSNFHECLLTFGNYTFPSSENAYQAYKSEDPKDWVKMQNVTAGQSKRIGKKLVLRPNWDQIKLSVMKDILDVKFSIPELRQQLLSTGSQELVEGNYWGDTYWGVCKGRGQNNLGKLLMQIREEIR